MGKCSCREVMPVNRWRQEARVWIFDGRAQQSITLRLDGPDWRTHSNKTLYRSGPWTVEEMDLLADEAEEMISQRESHEH